MSYEGFEEYLCINEHYHSVDAYSSVVLSETVCPVCSGKTKFWHSVDTTNGFEEGNPYTSCADVKEIGFENEWHVDHLGNKYAKKISIFEPTDDAWRKVKMDE